MNFRKTPKDFLSLASFALICLIAFPQTANAVPPPDFLFNIGSQLAQVFSIAVLFLSAVFSVSYKYIKVKLALMPSKKPIFITVSVVAILGVSLVSAYLYGEYKQNLEYNKWVEESEEYSQLEVQSKVKAPDDTPELRTKGVKAIDKLQIGAVPATTLQSTEEDAKFTSNIETKNDDSSAQFIKDYYEAIANQDLSEAYEMSKQSTNLLTFKGWYKDTTKITLDNLVRIDKTTSSVELTLYEGDNYTRYGVLTELRFKDGTPTQIASSSVRILSKGRLVEKGDEIIAEKGDEVVNFYTENQDAALSITNSTLNNALKSSSSDYIVLDAREDLEYENGYLEGSTHIRFADLQAGKWIEIPDDKNVYVLCWSGIRGKEVAEFLRTKNIVASYLENGANGWVQWGGSWEGNIKFTEKYTEDRYKKLFTTSQAQNQVANGVVLVDTREPWKFENWHITGSVSIPIMYTPTSSIVETFAQVPSGSTVITVCDGYVNCFDAKITAVELEERGHIFLGRYNKPWQYE